MATVPADRLSSLQLAELVNSVQPGTMTKGRIHLLFYIAWLRRLLLEGKKLKHKDERTQAEVMRERRADGRDIGPIPAVKDPERRKACERDLERFLLTYMRESFPLPFSDDHKHVLAKTQTAVLEGGLFAEAVFRGFGKTTVIEGAVTWAAVYGHRRFIPIIAADKRAGIDIIDSLKREFEENDLLADDFPEVCHPIRELEGIAHRCPGQTTEGKPTKIEWRKDALVLPFIPEAPSAGVVIKSFGLTGRLRGMKFKRVDGAVVRPDFAIIDDPQTDLSAASPAQCETREKLITGAVLGLAGHAQKLSAIMACTIIRKGDMADRLLDHKAHPEWQGDVLPMIRRWAERHESLWLGQYAELRRQDLPDEQGGRAEAVRQATEFYRAHQAEMDRGAEVSWDHCREPDELSAIQHAYNLLIDRGEKVFMAEFQNAPLDEYEGDEAPLEPRDVLAKANGLAKGICPHGSTLLTAFIDCRKPQLHYGVMAFGDGFRGHVADYGVRRLLRVRLGGTEAALTTALEALTAQLCGQAWAVEGGGELRLGLCLIDSGWQARTVYAFCRRSAYAAVLAPSKGQGGELELRMPQNVPRRDWGDGWFHVLTRERDARLLVYNVDRWKSFTAERIRTAPGGRGSLSLWGQGNREHWAFAEQATSERPAPKAKKTGEVFEKWTVQPGRQNHMWDVLVGCHVAAARMGMSLDAIGRPAGSAGRTVRLSDLQKARRA
jgi:hypothetical protein